VKPNLDYGRPTNELKVNAGRPTLKRLASLLLLLACTAVHALPCNGLITVCSAYETNSIVFRGKVVQAIPIPAQCPQADLPVDGTPIACGVTPSPEDFRFQVLETFKGDPGQEILVRGTSGQFDLGDEYVVFVSLNLATQSAHTSVCSPSHKLGKSEQDDPDLAWLRAYPTAPPTASIFGKVNMGYGITDIPSISVRLSGDENLTASSGEDHTYAFKDLPPGTYTLTAVLPAGYIPSDKETSAVTVGAKGCAEVDWSLRSDTHIKGTVTDAVGNLVTDARIGLLRPTQNQTGFEIVATHGTDANGNYDFSKVQPGDYWVALDYLGPNNNDPHVPVYYPSGADLSSAKLIHLDPAANIGGINLVATPALHQVSIHLHVATQDGAPAGNARIIANDPLTPTQAMTAIADENGDADIALYEGREYRLVASTSDNQGLACAGPAKFIAKENLQLGTITADKTWNQCRALQKQQ